MRTVKTPIAIDGLEGDVEVASYADQDLFGFSHRVTYRSTIRGGRVHFEFQSFLTADEHVYQLPIGSADSVGEHGKKWTHRGATPTDSTALCQSLALITTDYIGGGSEISYIASGEVPFSMPYVGTVAVPFT